MAKKTWLDQPLHEQSPEDVLQTTFLHDRFRVGQREMIDAVLQDKNIFCVAPTGSGKSLCFQLPALMAERGTTTLVVSPLIALMHDQVRKLKKLNLPVEELHSMNAKRLDVLEKAARGKYALLYSSPEQLQKDDVTDSLRNAAINRIAVDEAHCVSAWGHDFRPDYGKIGGVRDRLGIKRISTFTATASPQVEHDIKSSLDLGEHHEYKEPLLRPNLHYDVRRMNDFREKPAAIIDLIKRHAKGSKDGVIVYCGRKADTDRIRFFLSQAGIKAEIYHGDLGSSMRKEAEENFLNDKPRVIVATNAFGMGVDKPNVRLLIHHDMPGSVQSYLQETGRAGRDGKDSHCALLFSDADLDLQEYFIDQKSPPMNFVHGVYKVLKELGENSFCKPEGFFRINMFSLYRRFDVKRWQWGGMMPVSRDSAVNAAIDILRQCGALEQDGSAFRLQSFDEKNGKFSLAGELLGQRKRVSEAMLNQMVHYAKHPEPSQELLVELLQKELS